MKKFMMVLSVITLFSVNSAMACGTCGCKAKKIEKKAVCVKKANCPKKVCKKDCAKPCCKNDFVKKADCKKSACNK